MSDREIKNLVGDIHDAVVKIVSYTKDMSFDEFMRDEKTIDAIVRNFEIIGEASNRIPDDFKTGHPEIECGKLSVSATVLFMSILASILKTYGKLEMKISRYFPNLLGKFLISLIINPSGAFYYCFRV